MSFLIEKKNKQTNKQTKQKQKQKQKMYKGFSLDIVQYVAYIDQYPDRIVGRLVVIEFFFFFIFAEALS